MRKHRQNWLDVFAGFRVALDARKIVLGTLGVYVQIIVLLGLLSLAVRWWPGASMITANLIQRPVPTALSLLRATADRICPTQDPMTCAYSVPFGFKGLAFIAVGGILLLFIWSFFGGAIARIAAVDFAKDERPQIGEATAFAARKFGSFFWSPLVPLIFVLLFLICNMVLGLIGQIPGVGPIVMGLLFALAALSAFLVVMLLIGAIFGFIFMWPTIAMEGTDAFDAISRAFNYLFVRPWKTLWCWFMAAVYGAAVTAFVAAFTFLMLRIAVGSVALGMGKDFIWIGQFLRDGYPAGGASVPTLIAMILIEVIVIMAWGLVMGFVASYKITAATIIYSILRRDVDGTDMSEVYMPEPEEPAPAAGLETKPELTPVEPQAEPPPEQKPAQ